MFITYEVLTFIHIHDIPPNATFFRHFLFLKLKFLPDHTFERSIAVSTELESPTGSLTKTILSFSSP